MISPEKRTRPLPQGGLERARATAKHRKRMAVGSGGGGLAVGLVLVAFLTMTGSSGTQGLEIADDPTPSVSNTATPAPSATSSATADQEPSPSAEPGEEQDPDCFNNDCEEIDEGPSRSPEPNRGTPERVPYTEQPTTSFETQRTCIDAGGETPVHGEATCVMTHEGEMTARAGEQITIPMRLCVATNASGPVAFHFPSGGEHDVRVKDGDGNVVWSFAATVDFTGQAHDVELLPRQCRGYTTTWTTRHADGTPLEAGEYWVNPRSLANSRGGKPWSEDSKGLPFFRLIIRA